ncbi:MAG: hypothetical protein NTU44_14660 [Bacteroidetes bacterium]|nr:hypothetical protein [Bacteroidota bacterium]
MSPYSRPGIPMIKAVVMYYYGFTPELFHSKSKKGMLAEARFVAWYFEKRSGRSLTSLAKEYSRSHASVIYGIRTVDNWLLFNRGFAERLKKVESLIYYPLP